MKHKYLTLALSITAAASLTLSSIGSTAVWASSSDTSAETSSDIKKGGPGNGEVPPEKPDGENSGRPGNGETPPEKPDGENSGRPGGDMGGAPGGPSSGSSDITYTAVNEYRRFRDQR